MTRNQTILEFSRLVVQLQHAVTKFHGKTTLTQLDIDRMTAMLKLMEGNAHAHP
jgi:hypothetical protein